MQRSNPEIARFYNSPEWKRCRAAYKKSRMNLCERCGSIGYFVHHKVYINMSNIYDTSVTLNFDNLELLCKDCHNKEHFGVDIFDSDGNLKEQSSDIMKLINLK